ncbi:MAG: hypothetical protein GYA24_24875 [Candidatus Lokiarchaeota archaeon]|nr:hypothetical protein [Candidatus Lokiarchaeota archaeon]
MVSFAGFQKGAIAAAKKHGIELIEFRNCVESDLDGRLMKMKITLVGLSPQYEIHNMNIKVLSPQLDESDKARLLNSKLTLDKGHNSHLYNSAGHYIGDFLNIVQNIYEQEKRYIKHDDENTINVNWKDKDFCFRYNWEDKDLLIKINDFKLKITYNRMVDDLEIGSNDVSDWFIMDNLTIGKAVLIPARQVEAIKRKYNV